MLPFMTQPAVAPACHVPKAGIAGQSLLYRTDPAYLQFTPAVAGNRKLACLDVCVTPANKGANRPLLVAGDNTNDYVGLDISAGNMLRVSIVVGGLTKVDLSAVPVFRDVAAYHLRVVLDVDNAVAAERVRLYQDGARLAVSGTLNLASTDPLALGNTVTHRVGRTTLAGYTDQYAGLMADLVLVFGAVPAAFGERNIHGVWVRKPKAEIHAAVAAAGGFGAHGCHLDFSDPLSPGKDVSGRGNHWTAVGFDAAGKDTLASTPTNVFATLNPLDKRPGQGTLSDGNRTLAATTTNPHRCRTTMGIPGKGKYVWSVELVAGGSISQCGLMPANGDVALSSQDLGNMAGELAYKNGAVIREGVTLATYTNIITPGHHLVWAVDATNDQVWLGHWDGAPLSWFGGGNPAAGTAPMAAMPTGRIYPVLAPDTSRTLRFHSGVDGLPFAVPTGFLTLCTDNLPEPDIKDPAEAVMSATATGANLQSVMAAATAHWDGDGWLEWAFDRAGGSVVRSTVRGEDKATALATTAAEAAFAGFTSGANYVAHRWRLGARWGCIDMVVTKAAAGAETFTHGMGRTIGMMVARDLNGGDTYVFHRVLGGGKWIKLNSSFVVTVTDATAWANTAPTEQALTLGSAFPAGARVAVTLFAAIRGLSEFVEYSGTNAGTTDGAFAPMSILPQIVLGKHHDGLSNGSWWLMDTARNPANPVDKAVFPADPTVSEVTSAVDFGMDFVVGGLKLRNTALDISGKWLVAAWGRPVGGVCVAPATAR